MIHGIPWQYALRRHWIPSQRCFMAWIRGPSDCFSKALMCNEMRVGACGTISRESDSTLCVVGGPY